jgi:phenylacetate-coenzyme A ligase PaaK-like adenylate-forming protein
MINFTPLARRLMMHRAIATRQWVGNNIQSLQTNQLSWLSANLAKTKHGVELGLQHTDSYEHFRSMAPVIAYPQIRNEVMRMVHGEPDVLWPGVTRRFAQSSGTGDGKSKYIPVTDHSLRLNHYRGAADVVAHYLYLHPESRMFAGKGFILGGSFANELSLPADVKVGDLSANLIDDINPLINLVRVPSKEVALMVDWREKLPALVEASRHADVTNISGVPSWFLTVIKEVIKAEGADTIHDVWPNLEVFFHGGISMQPYRNEYARVARPDRMHYFETYNASEGFFAVQDRDNSGDMLLLLDCGVFYEFIPLDEVDSPHPAHAVPAWQVEQGKTYALVITAANGLCRYAIGDTVRIVSTSPLRIVIAGRTRHYINAFGEEVMVFNTDAAIARACEQTGASVTNYTVAPVFAEGRQHGRHQWLIEWATPPTNIADFARTLDDALQAENSDYQAKRAGSIFLDCLTIDTARHGLFDDWLASTGKLGGQRKVPRLSNNRTIIEALMALNC